MRKLALVNFIESFFSASLAVALPLYLLSRGINVEAVGLILSVSPLIFTLLRIVAALFAEVLGTRIFFIATSISESVSAFTFSIASSVPLFGLGRLFEGATYSLFWAVNRTKVIEHEQSKDTSLARLLSVRMVAATVGIGAAGVLISYSFDAFFQLLMLAGVVSLIASIFFWKGKGRAKKVEPVKMITSKKGKKFWEASCSLLFLLSAFSILFAFLLPVYLDQELGMPYEEIGALMMLFYLCVAVGGYAAIELGMDEKRLIFFQDIMVLMIALIPLVPGYLAPVLMMVGFGFGVSFAMQEEMVVKVSEGSEYPSTDVSILHMPAGVGEFAMLAAGGFLFAAFGSVPLFLISAVLVAAYVHYTRNVLC
ncbi:MAG: MFS transporter [Candidatus ainarchaeum sp.]|nr:MFS transporter [Candidatus ainarchaeum sp.]MDD5096825.1 MFS transporter [Candidatus ainarchaeum sp.]